MVALPVAAVHHEAVTRLTPGTPLVIAALCVVLGAVHCGRSSAGPTGADARGDAGGSGQDGGADAPGDARRDGATPPLDTGSDSPQDAVSLDCLSNSWDPCTFRSDCGGCCVDGTCLPKGASCGQGLGTCLGPSCSGLGAPGEACLTGQVFVAVGTSSDDPSLQCFYAPWTGCTTTSTICGDAGLCVPCGVAAAPCCEFIQIFCDDGLYCNDDQTCDPACGKPGQPCCYGDRSVACADGGVCLTYPASAPACVAGGPCEADGGLCGTCGNIGQACCGDGGCDEGLCASGTCNQIPPHP